MGKDLKKGPLYTWREDVVISLALRQEDWCAGLIPRGVFCVH